MRVSEVKREFDGLAQQVRVQFAEVREQFVEVNQRFEEVDRRFEEVNRRFEQVDRRFEQVDRRFEQIDQRFETINQRFEQIERRVEQVIKLEAETTRRHFDIVAEQIKSECRLAFEQNAAMLERLQRNDLEHQRFDRHLFDHDLRIDRLEGR